MYQRARSDEQKIERVDQIIEATVSLYSKMPYHSITLSTVAKELSFTRANLYKYFKTKEEIFLQIIVRDLRCWADDFHHALEDIQGGSIEEFAQIWSSSIARHSRLLELMGLMNTIIEQNVTLEKLVAHKQIFFQILGDVVGDVSTIFPQFSLDECNMMVHRISFYAIGLYPTTKQNELQEEAIAISQIPYIKPDFIEELSIMTIAYLRGVEARR